MFKAVTLCRSLEAVSSQYVLYVCCTDDLTYHALSRLKLKNCVPIALSEMHSQNITGLAASRTPSEFCWTLKSHLMMHLLQDRGLPSVLYCDSDVCFFGDPQILFSDFGNASVYLCAQRDVGWVEQKYGKYQAGVIGFRNDTDGLAALSWWKGKCREWCSAQPEDNRWGDQKYLDEIPLLFGNVKISTHRGIDAAPWNTVYNNNYAIGNRNGQITIDGDPLVVFHFACLDVFSPNEFDLWHLAQLDIRPDVKNAIYLPYLTQLSRNIGFIGSQFGDMKPFFSPKSFSDAKSPYILSARNNEITGWDGTYAFCTISSRAYVVKTLALYESIKKHVQNFRLWICCMDEATHALLSRCALTNVRLLRASEVETPAIRATRESKTLAEYCWTMKPALCSFVLSQYNVQQLLYCDSDIYFFSHPQPIYDTWKGYATLLCRQLGTRQLEDAHGIFQAGLIGFSKSAESLKVLEWWLQKCTEWCYNDHSRADRWGDQKYLQQIPDNFVSIKINNRRGIVAAPWNIVMNNTLGLAVNRSGSDVYIGSEKLICYHFGSLNIFNENRYDLWKLEPLSFSADVKRHIYTPYLLHLRTILQALRAKGLGDSLIYADAHPPQNIYTLGQGQESFYVNNRRAVR